MEASGESIEIIRESTRNFLKLNRQIHKDDINDMRRSVENMSISPDSLKDIVNRLKSKSSVSLAELHTLKNSLMEDTSNIELVLSTQGSLRGLVREISGTDIKRQCAAAGCCCNLALGDARACAALSKSAGPYLIAALDNLSEELAVSCAWALGNMAGSGQKACATLAAQGALASLAGLLRARRGEASDAAVYALTHFAYQMKDSLSTEYVERIFEAFTQLEFSPASCQLLFIVTCHCQIPASLPETLLPKILDAVCVSIQKHLSSCKEKDECCEILHLLRTLANLCVIESCSYATMEYFIAKNICMYLKKILRADNILLRDSFLWLLGNLYNSCGVSDFFNELACC